MGEKGGSHMLVFGPEGFYLCSCLQLLRVGRFCRHLFAALLDSQNDGLGMSITISMAALHPRWQTNTLTPWSREDLAATRIVNDLHGEGDFVPSHEPEIDVDLRETRKAKNLRDLVYADIWALTKKFAAKTCADIETADGLSLLKFQLRKTIDQTLAQERLPMGRSGMATMRFSGSVDDDEQKGEANGGSPASGTKRRGRRNTRVGNTGRGGGSTRSGLARGARDESFTDPSGNSPDQPVDAVGHCPDVPPVLYEASTRKVIQPKSGVRGHET